MGNGLPKVSEDEYRRRLSICESCDRFERIEKVCEMCGCKMENKALFQPMTCPVQKW